MTKRVTKIGRNLDQYCRELEAIAIKLKRPNLPLVKKSRLASRMTVVRKKSVSFAIARKPVNWLMGKNLGSPTRLAFNFT